MILSLGGESKWFQMFLSNEIIMENQQLLKFLFISHSSSAVELLEEVEAVRGKQGDIGDDSTRGVSGPGQDYERDEYEW